VDSIRDKLIREALDAVEMNNGYIYYEDAKAMMEDFYDTVVDAVQDTLQTVYRRNGW
jgi:hypothetical protein